jgi:hypothetical protein
MHPRRTLEQPLPGGQLSLLCPRTRRLYGMQHSLGCVSGPYPGGLTPSEHSSALSAGSAVRGDSPWTLREQKTSGTARPCGPTPAVETNQERASSKPRSPAFAVWSGQVPHSSSGSQLFHLIAELAVVFAPPHIGCLWLHRRTLLKIP